MPWDIEGRCEWLNLLDTCWEWYLAQLNQPGAGYFWDFFPSPLGSRIVCYWDTLVSKIISWLLLITKITNAGAFLGRYFGGGIGFGSRAVPGNFCSNQLQETCSMSFMPCDARSRCMMGWTNSVACQITAFSKWQLRTWCYKQGAFVSMQL